jgi:predicted ATPase/DNA-binding SARP family transcriptional activator
MQRAQIEEIPRQVELRLLGAPELLADGAPVPIERRKALALLAYLAVERGAHARDSLATLLAPDDAPASARAGLRRALAELAPPLRPWIEASSERIALRRDPHFTLDVDAFRAQIAAAPSEGDAALAAAVALYRGDFMAGFSLPGSAAFEEWQFFQAEQLRDELASALERLSQPEAGQSTVDEAIGYARRWLALDPLHEPAHRRLMQSYLAAGQPAAALRQYRLLSQTLDRELGVAPDEESLALYEQIRAGDRGAASSRWSSAPPRLPSAPAAAAAIETPSLPFLGRQTELARIAADLADPACRLLTLIGPGGMGKTRLAVQSAAANQVRFPDGIHQISLVGVNSADRLLSAMLAGLGLASQGDPLEQLAAALRDRRALLVLDNADQALDGAPQLRALLHRTRALKLLVTSRERLQLQEEWVIDLAGLEVPESDAAPGAVEYSAVQLFVQRARQVRADFTPNAEDLPAIVEICRLVEGMPLAIELAAAWVRVLTPADIARELAQSMALLTTTLRDVPERHRSVEGVFAQSWERLSEPERAALARLSAFEGGFSRAGAAEVAMASPLALAALTDKALLRRDRSGRYAIHELLRQFAARKLAEDEAEQAATMLRFCRFCMRLLEERNRDLQGPHQSLALAELEAEFDNLWNAWAWAVAARRLDELAAGLDGFYRVCELRGWYTDGILALERLEEELALAGDGGDGAQAVLVARGRARQGMLRCWVGQFAAAEQQLDAALPVLRAHSVAPDVAFTLTALGTVAYERGDEEQAQRRLREGLAAYQALDHASGVAWALDTLGDLAGSRGDYDEAKELLSESIGRSTALGDQASAVWSLLGLGRVLGMTGDHAAARQLLEESLSSFERLGDQHGVAVAHASLAEISAGAGDAVAARGHWLAALRLAREVGAVPLVLDAIVGAAATSVDAAGELALELSALAAAHPAAWKETVAAADLLRARARPAVVAELADQAERRGRALTWESAAAQLLDED